MGNAGSAIECCGPCSIDKNAVRQCVWRKLEPVCWGARCLLSHQGQKAAARSPPHSIHPACVRFAVFASHHACVRLSGAESHAEEPTVLRRTPPHRALTRFPASRRGGSATWRTRRWDSMMPMHEKIWQERCVRTSLGLAVVRVEISALHCLAFDPSSFCLVLSFVLALNPAPPSLLGRSHALMPALGTRSRARVRSSQRQKF
jgi:hypothetical protein